MATGAPFEGTSDAIPAAAEAGLELVVLLPDSLAPAVPLAVVFTSVLVPSPLVSYCKKGKSHIYKRQVLHGEVRQHHQRQRERQPLQPRTLTPTRRR